MQPGDLIISKELWTRALQWDRSDVMGIVAFTIPNYAVMYSLCNKGMNFSVLWDSLRGEDKERIPPTINRYKKYYLIKIISVSYPSKVIGKLTT